MSTPPELSVIVATHNRCRLLRTCLESLERQSAPVTDFEVVVVVDGSSDGTEEMLAGLEPPYRLTVVVQQHAGHSAARNAGAARAKGRVLLFIDDDEETTPDFVAAHLAAHRARDGICGVGIIARRVPDDADRLARMQAEGYDALYERLAAEGMTYLDAYGGNCSVGHATFDRIGGYAVDLPRETDFELAYRLHTAGTVFTLLPDAVVTEYRTRNWRGILGDVELRGRLAVELYRRHPPMITKMDLGGYGSWPRKWLGLRLVALTLRVPPRLLARIGFALPERAARRWFWFVLSYSYWRGVRDAVDPALWRRARRGTAILRYHAFGGPGERPSRYVVPGKRFARQLAWLKRRGYNVLSLSEYVDYCRRYEFPPPNSVVITVDDGYVDNDTVARPVLEQHGFPATIFLLTDPEARTRDRGDPALAGRQVIDLDRARDMANGIIEFGAHTRTHPDLTSVEPSAARAEILGSRDDLESALGVKIHTFAYPYGESNEEIRGVVEQSGFQAAVGVKPGHNRLATDPYDLRRIEIRGTDSLFRFAAMLIIGEVRFRR